MRRDIGWYATGPWAPSPEMFKPLSNLSTPLERTKTRGDLMFVRLESILMKLLLGTCWIALEPCGSRSYFLALLSDFSCCLNLDLVFEFESLSRPKVLLCSYISVISELVLSGSFSWARILLCFYSSWTREFTVAYACWLANLKLVEFPVNCQGNVNRNELEAKLKVN